MCLAQRKNTRLLWDYCELDKRVRLNSCSSAQALPVAYTCVDPVCFVAAKIYSLTCDLCAPPLVPCPEDEHPASVGLLRAGQARAPADPSGQALGQAAQHQRHLQVRGCCVGISRRPRGPLHTWHESLWWLGCALDDLGLVLQWWLMSPGSVMEPRHVDPSSLRRLYTCTVSLPITNGDGCTLQRSRLNMHALFFGCIKMKAPASVDATEWPY